MNKIQKIIISIALIIMGLWTLLFAYFLLTQWVDVLGFFISLLGFAFFMGGLVVLLSLKKS